MHFFAYRVFQFFVLIVGNGYAEAISPAALLQNLGHVSDHFDVTLNTVAADDSRM